MKTISKIEEIGVSQRDIDNWIPRLHLRNYEPTVRGRSRRYSWPNALDLAFISAFVKAGVRPSSAAAYAELFRDAAMRGQISRFFAFANGDPTHGEGSDDLDLKEWLLKFPAATSICLIPVREIADRVDAYFETHGVESE